MEKLSVDSLTESSMGLAVIVVLDWPAGMVTVLRPNVASTRESVRSEIKSTVPKMRTLTERGSVTGPRRESANANDKEESLSEREEGLTAIWTVGSAEGEGVGVGSAVTEAERL